jgi:hypothetical protein
MEYLLQLLYQILLGLLNQILCWTLGQFMVFSLIVIQVVPVFVLVRCRCWGVAIIAAAYLTWAGALLTRVPGEWFLLQIAFALPCISGFAGFCTLPRSTRLQVEGNGCPECFGPPHTSACTYEPLE